MSTMTSPSSRSRCRPMSGSVRVRRSHPTTSRLVAERLDEADGGVEELHQQVPDAGARALGRGSEAVRVLYQPEAQEQDDEKANAFLQHAVHRLLLCPGEGCGRRNARTTPLFYQNRDPG